MQQLYKSFRFQQPSTAIDKNLWFQCGFRPTVVRGYAMDSAGQDFIAVRDLTADGEVCVRANNSTAKDENNTSDGISFDDQGFSMISGSTLLNRNSAMFFIEAFGDLDERGVVTMSNDIPHRAEEPYGEGAQYDANINADGSGTASKIFSEVGIYKTEA